MSSSRRRAAGWTLVELAVAASVLAILVAIARPVYRGFQERALVSQAVVDLESFTTRIGSFRREFGQLPPRLESVVRTPPLDPWGNPYHYLRIEGAPPNIRSRARKDRNLVPINSDYDLYSAGPDGQTRPPLANPVSKDDVIRANDGGYFGRAESY